MSSYITPRLGRNVAARTGKVAARAGEVASKLPVRHAELGGPVRRDLRRQVGVGLADPAHRPAVKFGVDVRYAGIPALGPTG